MIDKKVDISTPYCSVAAKSFSSAKVLFDAIHTGYDGRDRRFFICIVPWAHRATSAVSRIGDAHHRTTANHPARIGGTAPVTSPGQNILLICHQPLNLTELHQDRKPFSHRIRHRHRTVCLFSPLSLLHPHVRTGRLDA